MKKQFEIGMTFRFWEDDYKVIDRTDNQITLEKTIGQKTVDTLSWCKTRNLGKKSIIKRLTHDSSLEWIILHNECYCVTYVR